MLITHTIATINVNGINSTLKLSLLTNLLHKQDIDIALIQEVTTNDFSQIYGYQAYVNTGTEGRGTAIIMKEGLNLETIKRLPSGRGIAGLFKDTWIVKIYAPSGAERRRDRENVFANDLALLLPTGRHNMLFGRGLQLYHKSS
jgi:exonuclease III